MKKKIMMNVEIEESLKNSFRETCHSRGRKMNYIIEKLMKHWIKKSKERYNAIDNMLEFYKNSNYSQLCSSIKCLEDNDIRLDYEKIRNELRNLFKLDIDGFNLTVNQMYRQYRDLCLEKKLIRTGEIFSDNE